MSADGDTVRAALWYAAADPHCTTPAFMRDPALAALARLEAAEQRLGVEQEMHEAATEECREWQDAARSWQDNYKAAEAQRDALAEALRRMSDTINAPVWPKNVRDAARAALAEAGLE